MFIARQPIFDRSLKVYGYELLFRSELAADSYGNTSAESATATVLAGLFELGIDQMVNGVKAFVNFDYRFLLSDSIELIDPKTLVIEVLEDVFVDEILMDRIKFLKSKGYKIALDDFAESFDTYPIVPIADIIKYDIMITPLDEIGSDVRHALQEHKVILAEKIETENEFIMAKEMGFQLFQGYFFSKPKIVGKPNARESAKVQYARMITELQKEEPSFQKLAEIVETDVNLSYRVMKVISSRSQEEPIYSIKKALLLMGFREMERWIQILMLQELATNKSVELIKLALVRTKFGEYIATNSKYEKRRHEIAMMCLFSTLDAILDVSMEDALSGIAVTEEIREALVEQSGPLMPIIQLMLAYEAGSWVKVKRIAKEITIKEELLLKGYLNSIIWVNDIMKRIS